MKLLNASAAILIGLCGAAHAADRLTSEGVVLPAQAITPGGGLEAVIDASGDEVLSVHTLLRPASSNIILMRDRDGFWVEWSGDRADLAPSAAVNDDGVLTYKVFQAPPEGVNAMTITVAYRTPDALKFGWFQAAVASEGSN